MWGLKGPYLPRSTVEPHLLAAAAGTIFQCVCSFQLALAPVQGAQASKSGVDCGTVDRTGKSKNLYPTTSLHEALGTKHPESGLSYSSNPVVYPLVSPILREPL